MANPLLRALGFSDVKRAVDAVVPRRTFADVILPPATRRAIEQALSQVSSHELIFHRWGLGERHPTGLALAFNFAGPSGTGKTICAEAIAHALGRPLLVVRYAEVASMWMGETPKNVVAVFRLARDRNAVLLFDEADAIASRRSTAVDQSSLRETNAVISVLLQELESFNGVVIFATNMAASFDPAFERRIRTHVLFEMPGVDEREQIWRVQMHPTLTPLARDVDFRALAERYEASGGDIRNAVLKAAMAAAAEPVEPAARAIQQRHLEDGIRDVLAAKQVMRQSIVTPAPMAAASEDAAALLMQRLESSLQPSAANVVTLSLPIVALLVAFVALVVAILR
jgi:SpoVK/Ycf46/Vps4 family AAA+-type ATPase